MYDSINPDVPSLVPADAKSVLDLGCGAGSLGEALGARKTRHVVGVTRDPEEAKLAGARLDSVAQLDLEDEVAVRDLLEARAFDLVILSHVLEHLRDSAGLLRRIAAAATRPVQVLVAVPNVLHWRERLRFLAGRFRYTQGGILDSTHLRFFDETGARELLPSAGLRLLRFEACGHLPGSRFLGRSIGGRLDSIALRSARAPRVAVRDARSPGGHRHRSVGTRT